MSTFVPSLLDLTNASNIISGTLPTGRLTGTYNISITGTAAGGAPPTGTAGGDLSGTYPNPTVLKINGVGLGSTTATSGNLLIGSGTQWITNAISGDGTLGSTGTLTITKTNGVSFAASATTDTTNAANISSGILPSGRLNGTYTSCIAGAAISIETLLAAGNNSFYLTMVNSAIVGSQDPFVNSALFFNPSTGVLTSTSFSGSWSGAAALTSSNDTNVTVTLGGTPSTALLAATSITMGWTGTLAAARLNSNVVQAITNDTNVTGSISAQNLTLGWTGSLAVTRGGTGQTTYTNGQLLIGNTTGNTLVKATLTGTTNQINVTNGAGSITLATPQDIATTSSPTFAGMTIGSSALTGTNSAVSMSGSLGEGQYINFGTGGRNIGIFHNGALFLTYNLNYSATSSSYVYFASNPAVGIQLGTTAGSSGTGSLIYAASGTAGNTVSASTALSWNSSGTINIPGLTASSLVATDGSSNLTSTTSGISPTFAGMTLTGTGTVNQSIITTTTGSANTASLTVQRGDQANGNALVIYKNGSTNSWQIGMQSGSPNFLIRDLVNSSNLFSITPGATGLVQIGGGLFANGDITANLGNVIVNTAGNGIKVKQGSNATFGTGAVLVSGTVTVSTTAVATGDTVFLSCTAAGGTQGVPRISSIVNGTSFTITSSQALDTSTYSWLIIKAA